MGFWQFATGGGSGGGTGDVVGPASSTDNAVARFDLATGKLIQNSALIVADTTGDISWNSDTGLARSAAGVVKVTDGGAGLGKIYVDGSTTSVRLGSRAYIGASGVDRVDIYDSAGATGSANIFSTTYGSHGGHFNLNSSYLAFKRNAGMQWSDNTSTWSANLVASLYSPASNTVSIGSGANGTGWATNVKVATSTVNAAGATSAASNLVPAGCILLGVTTRVTTAITSGDGGTSVDIGNGTDVDMYGDNIAFALGTTTDLASHTASALAWKSAAESVVFTCVGGTFNGGVWRVCAHYLDLTAPTS